MLDTATPLTMVLSETTGGVTTRYWHGLDTLAQSDGTTTQHFTYDGLGSVRQLVGESGSVGLAQTFDPYGNGYSKAGSAGSTFGYSGEQVDANGFVFLRARYYNPAHGRFFQTDPSRLENNLYSYVQSNPINLTDPTGLQAPCRPDDIVCEIIYLITEYGPPSVVPLIADGTGPGVTVIAGGTTIFPLIASSMYWCALLSLVLQPTLMQEYIENTRPGLERLAEKIKQAEALKEKEKKETEDMFVGFHATSKAGAQQIIKEGNKYFKGHGQLGNGFYVFDKNRPNQAIALMSAQFFGKRYFIDPIILRVSAIGYPDKLTHTEVPFPQWWVDYDASLNTRYDYVTSMVDGFQFEVGQVKFNQRAFDKVKTVCLAFDQVAGNTCP